MIPRTIQNNVLLPGDILQPLHFTFNYAVNSWLKDICQNSLQGVSSIA